jgi:hypothetical protein
MTSLAYVPLPSRCRSVCKPATLLSLGLHEGVIFIRSSALIDVSFLRRIATPPLPVLRLHAPRSGRS